MILRRLQLLRLLNMKLNVGKLQTSQGSTQHSFFMHELSRIYQIWIFCEHELSRVAPKSFLYNLQQSFSSWWLRVQANVLISTTNKIFTADVEEFAPYLYPFSLELSDALPSTVKYLNSFCQYALSDCNWYKIKC